MSVKEYKYLKFVRFKNLSQWNIEYYLNSSNMYSKYSLIFLNKLISPKKCLIKKEDYDGILPIVEKIVFKTGEIILRKEYKTGMNLYALKYNDLLVSNINFHQGATALNLLGDIVASTHYQPYSINEKIVNPAYLLMVLRSKYFLTLVSGKKAQGIKNESGYNFIGSFSIPVPSLKEQEKMVEKYNQKMEQSDKLAKEASNTEEKLEKYILKELGISGNKPFNEYSENATDFLFLKFVRYKNIDKWSYDAIVDNNQKILKSDYFENRSLKTLLYINPNTSFSDLDDNDEISFVPMESVSDKYGELKEYKTCKKSSSKGYTKFKNGDLIWAKITPCMQNGKSTVVRSLSNGYGCGSTEFYVLRNENENLNIDYVHLLLRLPIVLKDAMKHFTGSAGQQRVPKTYLENLSIPYPPLSVQNNIVRNAKKQMEEIKQMRTESEKLKQEALVNFEKQIFE